MEANRNVLLPLEEWRTRLGVSLTSVELEDFFSDWARKERRSPDLETELKTRSWTSSLQGVVLPWKQTMLYGICECSKVPQLLSHLQAPVPVPLPAKVEPAQSRLFQMALNMIKDQAESQNRLVQLFMEASQQVKN